MPDISMCSAVNEDTKYPCPKRHWCYRYLAEPDKYRQSYIMPKFDEDGCGEFWDNRKTNK